MPPEPGMCKAAFSSSPGTQSSCSLTEHHCWEKSLSLRRAWDSGGLGPEPERHRGTATVSSSQAQHPLAPISTSCTLVRPQESTLPVCTVGALFFPLIPLHAVMGQSCQEVCSLNLISEADIPAADKDSYHLYCFLK